MPVGLENMQMPVRLQPALTVRQAIRSLILWSHRPNFAAHAQSATQPNTPVQHIVMPVGLEPMRMLARLQPATTVWQATYSLLLPLNLALHAQSATQPIKVDRLAVMLVGLESMQIPLHLQSALTVRQGTYSLVRQH